MIISLELLLLLHNKILPSFLFILLGVSETYMKSFQLILSACSLQLLPHIPVYSFISKSCGYVIISFIFTIQKATSCSRPYKIHFPCQLLLTVYSFISKICGYIIISFIFTIQKVTSCSRPYKIHFPRQLLLTVVLQHRVVLV